MSGKNEPKKLLTREELSAFLNINVRQIGRLVEQGMPEVYLGPRTRRYELEAVKAWLDKNAKMKRE